MLFAFMKKCKTKLLFISAFIFASLFTSCHSNISEPNIYDITFVFDENDHEVVQYEEGSTIKLLEGKEKDGYDFMGWYDSDTFDHKVEESENLIATSNQSFFAFYQDNNKGVLIFHSNIPDESETVKNYYDLGSNGQIIACPFNRDGYYFIGWGVEKEENERLLQPGQYVTVTKTLELYAIWQQDYSDKNNHHDFVVQIYENQQGLGSAVLIQNGESKNGFYNSQTHEFEFIYDTGSVLGIINDDNTYTLCNLEQRGRYYLYDYLFKEENTQIKLSLDGYSNATIELVSEDGLPYLLEGIYSISPYKDYVFQQVLNGELTDTYFYFDFVRNSELYGFDGEFYLCGSEAGAFSYYKNGILFNELLYLDGYGNAVFYKDYVASNKTYKSMIEGKYLASDNYSSLNGEYRFIANDGSMDIKFMLYVVDVNGQENQYVFMTRNNAQEGQYYQNEGETYPSIYLDGYLGIRYYIDESTYLDGTYIAKGESVEVTFYDKDNKAIGTNKFIFDFANRLFVQEDDGFVISNNVLEKYIGTSQIIHIPEGVTSISENAFNCYYISTTIYSVYIPKSVTYIGKNAFTNNGTIKYVYLESETPPTLVSGAFNWQSGDFKIIVPDGYEEVYREAENWSSYANYITSNQELNNRPEFEVVDQVLVRYNPKENSDLEHIAIPDEVLTIDKNVFKYVTSMKTLDLNNVQTIRENAFLGCENLETINSDNKVLSIESGAFVECYKLNNLVFNHIVSIGANAFSGCYGLDNIELGANIISIGDMAFSQCSITVSYNQETNEEILANNLFFITIKASEAPLMGNRVFRGTSVRIRLNDIDTWLRFAQSDKNWSSYLGHLYLDSGDEKGDYISLENLLKLHIDGRAEFYEYEVWFYELDGNNMKLYLYDQDEITVYSAKYQPGEYILIENTLKFVLKGSVINYISSDNDTLTIDTNYKDRGYYYYYDATFNEEKVTVIASYSGVYFVLNNYRYDLTLKGDGTFTYTKSLNPYSQNVTCNDGSSLTLNFSQDSILITGTLQGVITTNGTPVHTDFGWYATKVEDNKYYFEVTYLTNIYQITVTLNGDSFTYSYATLTQHSIRDESGNYLSYYVDENGEVTKVSFSFKTANGFESMTSYGIKDDEGYLFTFNRKIEVVDPETGETTYEDSELNGTYRIIIDFTNQSFAINKL